MVKILIFSSLLLLLFSSFQEVPKLEDKLIGVWVYQAQQDKGYEYGKVREFLTDLPGVEFMRDGKLIVRENSGWCGTAPISYEKYEGTWQLIDSTFIVKRKCWRGYIKEVWELTSVTPTVLKVTKYGEVIKKN